jgi:glycosyltransferase involved in cell wall biosynthesis
MSQKGVHLTEEDNKGVHYIYTPDINIVFIKHIFRFLYVFVYVLFWSLGHRRRKAIVCDALNVSASAAAIIAGKLIGVSVVGVLTDVPTYSFSRKLSFQEKINFRILAWFDKYVFLTEEMNNVVNKKNRPYIVMEGLVDSNSVDCNDDDHNTPPDVKTILFAGGIGVLNGIPILLDAFKRINNNNIRLELYGFCNIQEIVNKAVKEDSRIKLYGVRPSSEVEIAEKKASLLVNPRNVDDPCVPFSFPSKNLEYMKSGTPVVTTKLCCIPQDHHEHLFFFPDNEDPEEYAKTLEDLLALPWDVLRLKGKMAREFVLKKKNKEIQAKRIIELVFANHA